MSQRACDLLCNGVSNGNKFDHSLNDISENHFHCIKIIKLCNTEVINKFKTTLVAKTCTEKKKKERKKNRIYVYTFKKTLILSTAQNRILHPSHHTWGIMRGYKYNFCVCANYTKAYYTWCCSSKRVIPNFIQESPLSYPKILCTEVLN